MSSLFGGGAAKKSLTESIFGQSSSNSDLFSKPATHHPSPADRKRPRTSTAKKTSTSSGSTARAQQKAGGRKKLSRKETLRQRRQQSQDEVLDQLTISLKDYRGGGCGGCEELYGDVRGLMKHHGLVIIRDALSEEEVASISNLAGTTQRRICDALDAKKIPYNSPINNTKTIVFEELAVRCQGRMDVRYKETFGNDEDNGDAAATCNENNEQQQQQVNGKLPPLSLIDNLATSVLHGAEPPNLVYSGWIFSFPGSADQPWHQDGSPLFEKGTESLPSYALNIFCGLHDTKELMELGPTEFVVGSHHMEPEIAMDKVDTAATVSAVLGKGDILLYDYRICHRGTSNLASVDNTDDNGGVVRKVLYLMYARPWFREHLNFGSKSLFE